MCVEGGDCSCKVELKCFKGAKHKFEIDYEYQVRASPHAATFKSFAIFAFYYLTIVRKLTRKMSTRIRSRETTRPVLYLVPVIPPTKAVKADPQQSGKNSGTRAHFSKI